MSGVAPAHSTDRFWIIKFGQGTSRCSAEVSFLHRCCLLAGAAHWELLLRARAVECQAYVIAAAQAGKHNEKRESYGHSLIVDPWGVVVGRLDDPQATGESANSGSAAAFGIVTWHRVALSILNMLGKSGPAKLPEECVLLSA